MEQNRQANASPADADIRAASPLPRDLDEALARAGLALADAQALLGVARDTLYNWRKRRAVPRGDLLVKLAALVGLSPEETLVLAAPAPEPERLRNLDLAVDSVWVLYQVRERGPLTRDELEALWSGDELGEAA